MKALHIAKKYMLVCALCLGISAKAHAQKMPADQRAQQETDLMACELKLDNAKQVKQVYNINLKAAQRMDEISAKYRMNISAVLRDGKEVDKDRDIALQDVLTPSQWSRFERLRKAPDDVKADHEAVCRKQ